MKALSVLLLGVLFGALHLAYYGIDNDPIFLQNGALRISDFAYYVVIIRSFWFGGPRGIYSLEDNLAVLRELLGTDIGGVMPLAVTPASAFLFLPFAVVSLFSMSVAKSFWCGLSMAAVLTAASGFRDIWTGTSSHSRIKLGLAAAIVFLSHSFFLTLWLGQTSLFFFASLLSLLNALRKGDRRILPVLPALFFAGLKPTYFGIMVLVLLVYGAWRAISIAASFLAAAALFCTVYTSPVWISEYVSMFTVFSRYPLPPEFRLPFAFDQMNVFRSGWSSFASQETLLTLSRSVLFIAVAGGAVSILRNLQRQDEIGAKRRMIILTACYVLFSPYLSPYEEILAAFPILLIISGAPEYLDSRRFLSCLLLLFLVLNFNPLLTPWNRELLWIAKAVLFALYAVSLGKPSREFA